MSILLSRLVNYEEAKIRSFVWHRAKFEEEPTASCWRRVLKSAYLAEVTRQEKLGVVMREFRPGPAYAGWDEFYWRKINGLKTYYWNEEFLRFIDQYDEEKELECYEREVDLGHKVALTPRIKELRLKRLKRAGRPEVTTKKRKSRGASADTKRIVREAREAEVRAQIEAFARGEDWRPTSDFCEDVEVIKGLAVCRVDGEVSRVLKIEVLPPVLDEDGYPCFPW